MLVNFKKSYASLFCLPSVAYAFDGIPCFCEKTYYFWTTATEDNQNNDVIVVQIAGLIARRIVCETNKDQELNQGDRLGMIRFGSRVDVYYENYEPLVKVGQTAISGETLLAKK